MRIDYQHLRCRGGEIVGRVTRTVDGGDSGESACFGKSDRRGG